MNALEVSAADCAWADRPVAEKLLLFGGLLLCAVVLPPRGAAPAVVVVVVVALAMARVRPALFAAAMVGPAVFVALGVVPVTVDVVGGIRGGGWIGAAGIGRALDTALRALSASAATIALACTTSLSALLAAARRAGLPAPLCHVTDTTYRLIGLLVVTARSLRDTLSLRLGLRSTGDAVRAIGSQGATVFVLAVERSRRLHESMALRAEPGALAVADTPGSTSAARLAPIVATLAAVVAIGLLA